MASSALPPGGGLPHPPPSHRDLSTLTIEIATCLRDAAGGGGATQPSAGEPVSRRMRALLPQLLGTCVEAAGTAADAAAAVDAAVEAAGSSRRPQRETGS